METRRRTESWSRCTVRSGDIMTSEEQGVQGWRAAAPSLDRTAALCALQRQRREEEELQASYEQRRQVLESLDQRIEELQKDYKNAHEFCLSLDVFLKEEDASQAAEKAEREIREVLQKEEELERLKETYAQLISRKQELQLEQQRHYLYWDFMEQVVKMSKFEDVDSLTVHLGSLLHFREKLYKKYNEAQEQVDQLRQALAALEDQHHVIQLQKNNELSQLQSDLEETHSEVLLWERHWNHIQETAAKETLLLGKIKMATLNLYEMAGGKLEGEEDISVNDTETQLERIKLFIQDHEDMIKTHQSLSEKQSGEQKGKTARKPAGTHHKKH